MANKVDIDSYKFGYKQGYKDGHEEGADKREDTVRRLNAELQAANARIAFLEKRYAR